MIKLTLPSEKSNIHTCINNASKTSTSGYRIHCEL